MNKARRNPVNIAAAHGILILYTLIALFPVFVILINSFKTRKAIFRDPLALPDAESFSLIGYQTVLKQGDFFLYFQKVKNFFNPRCGSCSITHFCICHRNVVVQQKNIDYVIVVELRAFESFVSEVMKSPKISGL